MSKTKTTLKIEQLLAEMCTQKRIYGCEEVTIGFYNQGRGNEVVDFITMDSKGIVKCYEIKVSLQDLKSSAKKSWYGHYNYLVVSQELYNKVDDWDKYIPKSVGIMVFTRPEKPYLSSARKPKLNKVSDADLHMLKESMIRSMYYKKEQYKDANNLAKTKALKKEVNKLYKKYVDASDENRRFRLMINHFEWGNEIVNGIETSFQELSDQLSAQALKMIREKREKKNK